MILLKSVFLIAIAVIFVTGIILSINVSAEENLIPSWVKSNAGWWADGTIDDDSFIQGIQFLINTGAVIVPEMDNLKMENAELQKRNKVQEEGIGDLIDERVKLTYENVFLKQSNDELLVELAKSEMLLLAYQTQYTSSAPTSAPKSTGLSGQSIPNKLWGSVDAEYYDSRYERLNVEIHTSDKYENDFVFKQGYVDVVVGFEKEHEERTQSSAVKEIVSVPVVVLERTIEFSESDYSYDNKLIFEIEGCLPAKDQYLGKAEIRYFIEATIWSDMGSGFTFNDEFTVSVGSCQG
jgi:hypothetical protein